MARGRRGCESDDNAVDLVSIKSTLNSILRRQHANEMIEIIFDRCKRITEISALATLLILWTTNVDDDDIGYFSRDAKREIFALFDAVTTEHTNRNTQFHNHMEAIHGNYQWPSKRGLYNSYNYFREQYIVNVKTNLKTHCKKNLTHFLRIKCYDENLANPYMAYDGIDIRNVIKDVMNDEDWTDNDNVREYKKEVLLQHLVDIGFPENVNIKDYVNLHWFQSIWAFIRMQRVIESFLDNRGAAIEQWKSNNGGPRPPTVHNFTVIPNCDCHLKHIKIDSTDCYYLASKFRSLPQIVNEGTGRKNNRPLKYYTDKKLPNAVKGERQAELFDTLFDMDKIRKNGKQHKMFYGQIVTDSVSASVIYERGARAILYCMFSMIMAWFNNQYKNVIGIDPGDKTWMAAVRRNIQSRVEVSNVKQFQNVLYLVKCVFMIIIFFYLFTDYHQNFTETLPLGNNAE